MELDIAKLYPSNSHNWVSFKCLQLKSFLEFPYKWLKAGIG